jgi:hypothetical protein
MPPRIAIIVLAILLALPFAQTAAPVEAKQRSRTVTRTYRNPAAIELPLSQTYPVSASQYPSAIAVRGLKGPIRDVNLRLNNLEHDDPEDVAMLLVGPGGQTAIVLANVGGTVGVSNVTLRLDDEATSQLTSNTLQSGTFQPTNNAGGPVAFNTPAPSANGNAALSVFDGTNPNGTWHLFVQYADNPSHPGAFAGGWELEITAKVKAKKRKR